MRETFYPILFAMASTTSLLIFVFTALGGMLIALLLSLWLSDRYFGELFLGGHVKPKEVDFIRTRPPWQRGLLQVLMI
ncbi:MAG: hypothetical protein ACTSXS_09065, partial [Candidatus Thorarchaeota archaeon]